MSYGNAARIQRERHDQLADFADRTRVDQPDCAPSVLCQTAVETTYPTTAASVFYALTGDFDVVEKEGQTAAFVADGGNLYAVNNGTQVPPVSTLIIAHSVGGKWCFRFDG